MFFIISGYFLYNEKYKIEQYRFKLANRIKRLIPIIFISSFIYIGLNNGIDLTISKIIKLMVFNYPEYCVPLWFLFALLYSYIILYCFPELFFKKNYYLVIIFIGFSFYILQLMSNVFGLCVLKVSMSSDFLYLNYFARGLPCIATGIFIKKNRMTIFNIENRYLMISILMFGIASVGIQLIYKHIWGGEMQNYFISNIFASLLLIHSEKNKDIINLDYCPIKLDRISLQIYILHPAIIVLLTSVCNSTKIVINRYFFPLIVAILTTCFSIVLSQIIMLLRKCE